MLRSKFDVVVSNIWSNERRWYKRTRSLAGSYQRLASDFMKTLVFLKWIHCQHFEGNCSWKGKWIIFYRKDKINFKGMFLFSTGLMKETWLVISNMYFKCYLNARWLLKMFNHQWFRKVSWGSKKICTYNTTLGDVVIYSAPWKWKKQILSRVSIRKKYGCFLLFSTWRNQFYNALTADTSHLS